jgi:hypothetical protein
VLELSPNITGGVTKYSWQQSLMMEAQTVSETLQNEDLTAFSRHKNFKLYQSGVHKLH